MDYKNSFNSYTHGMEGTMQQRQNDATYTSGTFGRPQQENYQQAMMARNAVDSSLCPNCGAPLPEDADYCESCHRYIKSDTCSFCGAHLQGEEAYCPECGNPRGGIVCPRCNTMNEFAFCKQCGKPLTEDAKMLFERVRMMPEYQQMQAIAEQLSNLDKMVPLSSEAEILHEEANKALRERVLTLLAQDRGEKTPDIPDLKSKRITEEEYKIRKNNLAEQLMEALEAMQTRPMESPVEARNYTMAMKPAGLRLAWKCNYKNAIHSGPCGCAKPHLGGRWIILGKNSKSKMVDDNG